MISKKNIIMFVYLNFINLNCAPALTTKQQLNKINNKMKQPQKKITQIKKAIPIKTINKQTTPQKTQPTKVTVIGNLSDLTKAIEKFHADQKKIRTTNRSQLCNQYPNIQDRCPCTGVSCVCPEIPKLLTI